MIKTINIVNFTAFSNINLDFARNLNVFVGENGTGKTHILKLLYTVLACNDGRGKKSNAAAPTKALYQTLVAEKLMSVFMPESLGRLTRRKRGRERCEIDLAFEHGGNDLNVNFSFATNSKTEVVVERFPETWSDVFPAYFPVRELMAIFPNFVSVYESHYLEFEETWRDICLLLGAPAQKGPREQRVRQLLAPLETLMGGSVELDKSGSRFFLKSMSGGKMEMPLVADGIRKIGMLARLIATGALLERGYLFWDEPEANLNAKLIRSIAQSIVDISSQGIQVFLATHSLFLLRELEILLSANDNAVDAHFFGLRQSEDGVMANQGASMDDVGDIAALDAELEQSDRFMGL
jgi:energy-coupling factor transporter ATP-binding protein EcfA2